MFGDRMCSSYIRELEEWLSMFTYDYEIAEVTKVLNAPYIYKVKVIEFSPDCSYENSYRYDLFITTSGDIKNEDGDSVLNAEANNCAGDITILEFIRNFRVEWIGKEKIGNNINITDCKVTRQQFLDAYNKELDILFNEVEEISEKAHIYGYPVTVHWNGMYCDCGDGATPSNYIIPAIADCESELDDEDDINVKENDMENNNIEFDRWIGACKHINNFNLAYDIPDIQIDPTDEWDVECPDIMVYVGENLRNDIILQLDLSKDEREGLENYGWLDCYAHFNIKTEEIEMIFVNAYLGANDYKYLYIYISNSQDRKGLYKHLYTDEGFAQFVEEIKEYNAEMENDIEKAKMNEKETIIENFMEALDIFQKAFENLAYYAGSYYIKDEWFDGRDNYPFNWSFEEMPGVVEAWVEGVKDNVKKASEPVIKYETNYSAEADRTFIMKCTYKRGDCIREECVGFYSGEPDEANKTEDFIGDLVAEYNWD